MIKIGFTSLIYNYGSVLQCYATKRLFEKNNVKCDYINYSYYTPKLFKYSKWYKKYKNNNCKPEEYFVDKCFQENKAQFVKNELNPKFYDYKTLKKLNCYYDHYIIGSDQVWNFNSGVSYFPLLPFSKSGKCSSFSSSFGSKHLGCSNRLLKKELAKFKYLSVREETGVEIIKNIVHREAELLPDPVVGLGDNEWRSFYCSKSTILFDNYILLHFLNKPNEHSLSLIRAFINDVSLPVLCFFGNYNFFDDFLNISYIDGTPYDLLNLIDNARYVLTDSFHTAQFSVIFHKKFFVFERNYSVNIPQSDRIIELVNKYDCHSSYVSKNTVALDIDIETANNDKIEYWKEVINNYTTKIITSIPKEEGIAGANECTNCGACLKACPVNAIKNHYLINKTEYKKINKNKCKKCGLCRHKCQTKVGVNNKYKKSGYIGYSNDATLRETAASGGLFATIAKYIISEGGIVYGSHLILNGKKTECKTIGVDVVEDLPKILNSKYVECEMSNCFENIKQQLERKRLVLVGSTSCKINGLLNYLGKAYENLYTVDLVCHGTPSINLFRKNIGYLEKKYKGKISNYSFRSKPNDDSFEWSDFYNETLTINYKEKTTEIVTPYSSNIYLQLFMRGMLYRDNCYFCDFASLSKPADITLGDYFELKNDYPNIVLNDEDIIKKGVNCIITHTEKGDELIHKLGKLATTYKCPVDKIRESHLNLYKSSDYNVNNARVRDFISKFGFHNYILLLRVKQKYKNTRHVCGKILRKFF